MPIFPRSIISGAAAGICRCTLLVAIPLAVLSFLSYPQPPPHPPHTPPATPESPMMAAAATVKSLTVPAVAKHTATVIFVHGLGDTGHGWKPVADMFRVDPALAHVKWVLPHSPIRKVTANMGIEMPSWYDIFSFGFDTAEDEAGMLESAKLINQVIATEVESGTDPNRIVLGGFSQGGTMSILTGLTTERKLAGIACLSGWVPMKQKFKSMTSPHAAQLPVFWGHGAIDPLVKFQMCKDSVDFLSESLGLPLLSSTDDIKGLTYNLYDGLGHTTSPKELEDLKEWIKKAIPAEGVWPAM